MPKLRDPLLPVIIAKPLEIDSLLGQETWNRIKRIGIELEGAWSPPPVGMKVVRDGSVFKDAGDDAGIRRASMPGYAVGEIALGPMLPASLSAAIRKYYPQLHDKSCGLHVHMSFENVLHYTILTVPEYQETIIHYLTLWAEKEALPKTNLLWDRLLGKNAYCQKKFWPDEQMRQRNKDYDKERHGHRYTIVHYPFNRTGTVEVRLLPMFDSPQVAIRGIQTILDVTNACLIHLARRYKRSDSGKFVLPTGEIYEEVVQEIL